MVRRSFDLFPERETLGTYGVVDFHDFNRLQDTRKSKSGSARRCHPRTSSIVIGLRVCTIHSERSPSLP